MGLFDDIGTQASRLGNFLSHTGVDGAWSLPFVGSGSVHHSSTKNWGQNGEQYDLAGNVIDPSIYPSYNADGTSKTGGATLTQDQINGHPTTGATQMPNAPYNSMYALSRAYPGADFGPGPDGLDHPLSPNMSYDTPPAKGLAAHQPAPVTPPPPVQGPNGTNAPALMGAASNTYQAQSQRYDDQYKAIQGRENALTPEMIAAGTRNAFNQPYLASDGQDARGLAAQNGGGHMGGYGSANQDAIRAGAGQMANTAAVNFGTAAANEQNAFTQQKGTDLANLNSAYGNIAQGWGDQSNSAQRTSEFNTNQQNLVDGRYQAGAAGYIAGGMQMANTPVGQHVLGGAVNAIGQAATGAWNAATSGGTTPQPSYGGGTSSQQGGGTGGDSGSDGSTYSLSSLDDSGMPKKRPGLYGAAPNTNNYRGA